MALDTGILSKFAFQGAELQRTGLVLCAAPVAIGYLYYRSHSEVSFAHDLRTAIAVAYKKLCEPVYYGGPDLLTHIPSVRNLEAYDSLRAPRRMRLFHERTTDFVTILLLLGPVAGLVYCLVRLWHYPDVGGFLWSITTSVSALFAFRAWFFGLRSERDDEFARRSRGSPANHAMERTADRRTPDF